MKKRDKSHFRNLLAILLLPDQKSFPAPTNYRLSFQLKKLDSGWEKSRLKTSVNEVRFKRYRIRSSLEKVEDKSIWQTMIFRQIRPPN